MELPHFWEHISSASWPLDSCMCMCVCDRHVSIDIYIYIYIYIYTSVCVSERCLESIKRVLRGRFDVMSIAFSVCSKPFWRASERYIYIYIYIYVYVFQFVSISD